MCRAPHNKAVLLYGAPGTGKSLLAHAITHDAGASLFDLSPGVTNGLYPGKKGAALLVQMVFRAAKAFSPSVVLIDGCEKVSSHESGANSRQRIHRSAHHVFFSNL